MLVRIVKQCYDIGTGDGSMKIRYKTCLDIVTETLSKKYEFYSEKYEDVDECLQHLFDDLKSQPRHIFEMFVGVLMINYVEENFQNIVENEAVSQWFQQVDVEEAIDRFTENPYFFEETVECTLDKAERTENSTDCIYEAIAHSKFANIYSRFDPFFECDEVLHRINYPKDPTQKAENEFYDQYEALQSVWPYREHILYVLTDLIKNKYEPDTAQLTIQALLKNYYYFMKGKALLNETPVAKEDQAMLKLIESCDDIEDASAFVYQDQDKIQLVIDRCCYYQDHVLDKNQQEFYQKTKQMSYMNKFPKSKVKKDQD